MSLFSYISFPRSVDKSCLVSKFDKSKAYTIGEIRRTDFEKQFQGDISQFPDSLNVYFGDMSDLDGIDIFDTHTKSFRDIFKNEFIYCFNASFRCRDSETAIKDGLEIYRNSTDAENGGQTEAEFLEYVIKSNNDTKNRVALCRQQLYDIVQLNTYCGEIVEIFSAWGHDINIYTGPPAEIRVIAQEKILSSELLNLQDDVKLEIHHTV